VGKKRKRKLKKRRGRVPPAVRVHPDKKKEAGRRACRGKMDDMELKGN